MNEMQDLILDMANRLLSDHCGLDLWSVQDEGQLPQALWQSLQEQGLLLAGVSEEQGGAGLEMSGLMKLAGLSGYHATPAPLAETLLFNMLASLAKQEPTDAPGIVVFPDEQSMPKIDATGVLKGQLTQIGWSNLKPNMLFVAYDADHQMKLVCLHSSNWSDAASDKISLSGERSTNLDLTGLSANWIAPLPAHLDAASIAGMTALCRSAQMTGAMQRALELSLTYVMERKQFGRALAKFQAVQHMLAEAAQHYCASQVITECAAEHFGSDQFALFAAMAKARSSEAVRPVIDSVHQCHGAIGFTREYALQYFSRRLWDWRDDCGNELYWSAKVGKSLLSNGQQRLWHQATAL